LLAVTVGAGADNPPNGVRTHLNLDVLAALDLRGHGGAERIVRRHDHEGEDNLADDVEDRVRDNLSTPRVCAHVCLVCERGFVVSPEAWMCRERVCVVSPEAEKDTRKSEKKSKIRHRERLGAQRGRDRR
jgi:hypothetical protein